MLGVNDAPEKKPAHGVLLVTYWYPPAIGAAAERLESFARYLPEHDWTVHVLTAGRESAAPEYDGVAVHSVTDPRARPGPTFADYDPREQPSRWKGRLRDYVFPDRFRSWQKDAFAYGQSLLTNQKVDVILASFPPASAAQLALRLHLDARTPLVLDFRDNWIGPGGYNPQRKKALDAHLDLQRQALACASAVITVSDAMADHLANEHNIDRAQILVIPNGYEPAGPDLPELRPQPNNDVGAAPSGRAANPVTISHVGTVIRRNRPDLFFAAVAKLKEEDHAVLDGVCFRFVGNLSRDYLAEAGLSAIIQTTGLVPRDQASAARQGADGLLLLTGNYVGQWGYSAKIFEYIQTGRPILCLEETPGSNDRRLLEQFCRDRSFFAPVGDAAAIAEQLSGVKRYLAERPTPAMELDAIFRDYSRQALAAVLASKLAGLVETTNATRRTGQT
jgi:glycosyltransferase involved in cell wall biosynthesis